MTKETSFSPSKLEVLVFGPQAQAVGMSAVSVAGVTFPVTASDVLRMMSEQHRELHSSIKVSRLAVNQEFADGGTEIHFGDEVALIGLISGG